MKQSTIDAHKAIQSAANVTDALRALDDATSRCEGCDDIHPTTTYRITTYIKEVDQECIDHAVWCADCAELAINHGESGYPADSTIEKAVQS